MIISIEARVRPYYIYLYFIGRIYRNLYATLPPAKKIVPNHIVFGIKLKFVKDVYVLKM